MVGGFLVGLIVTLVAAAVLAVTLFIVSGGPVADEWDCSKGEYPAFNQRGGSACFTYGERLPRGWTAYPKGNQPLGVNQ